MFAFASTVTKTIEGHFLGMFIALMDAPPSAAQS